MSYFDDALLISSPMFMLLLIQIGFEHIQSSRHTTCHRVYVTQISISAAACGKVDSVDLCVDTMSSAQ